MTLWCDYRINSVDRLHRLERDGEALWLTAGDSVGDDKGIKRFDVAADGMILFPP